MSTVRIQLRRGTATEWTNADTALNASGGLVLAAGEMGVETNTRKIKIGDGTSRWSALSYVASDSPAITEIAQDAIDQALSMGSGLTKSYNDSTNTISLGIDDEVIATVDYVDTAIGGLQNTVTSDYVLIADVGNAGGPAKLNADGDLLVPKSSIILEGSSANEFETTLTVTNPTADRTITLPDETGTVALTSAYGAANGVATLNSSTKVPMEQLDLNTLALKSDVEAVQAGLIIKEAVNAATTANLSSTYANGTADQSSGTGVGATLTMSSNGVLTIDGITLAENDRVLVKNQSSSVQNGIYTVTTAGSAGTAAVLTRSLDSNNNPSGELKEGVFVFVRSGTINTHDGFILNGSASLPRDVIRIGTDSITFTQFSGSAIITAGNGIINNNDTISIDETYVQTVSSFNTFETEIGTTISDIEQDIADLEGDVSSINGSITTINNSFATLESPTFTGTVVLPTTTSIGDVSSTEIGYVNGVTSGIQSQLDARALGSDLSDHITDSSTHGVTGDLVGTTDTQTLSNKTLNDPEIIIGVGLGNITISNTEIGYLNGLTSSIQSQLDEKATPSDISTHNSDTTSVHGITDTAQIALLNAANQTFTGNMEVDGNLVVDGNFTVNGTNFNASATTIVIEDSIVQLAHQNAGNTVDLGLVVGYNESSTAKHSGIVRDVSANKWKLFKGVTTEPTTTVDFSEGSLDDLELNEVKAAGVVFTDGTQTKEGVPSRTPIISKTANYTLSALSERDSLIEVNSTEPVTITIPANATVAYPVGTTLDILGINTGLITIAGAGGVTVNATPGLKLRTQWSSATLLKRAENSWVVYGDLKS
jgi:hypothetical protein